MVRPLEHHHVLHGVEVQRLHRADEDLSLVFMAQAGSLQQAGSASFGVVHLLHVDAQGGQCTFHPPVSVDEWPHGFCGCSADVFVVSQHLSLHVDRACLDSLADDLEDTVHALVGEQLVHGAAKLIL